MRYFGDWLRCFFGSSLLPAPLIVPFIDDHMRQFQVIASLFAPENRDNANNFREYLKREWLPKIQYWCQDGNNGPRTTNVAEAWHNRIRTYSFSHLHPELNRFIHELQIEHNNQRRRLQMLIGVTIESDGKSSAEIWKDEEISSTRQHLITHSNWLAQNNIQITYETINNSFLSPIFKHFKD